MHPNSSIHWNAYPSALAAICLAAGIVSANRFECPMPFWLSVGSIFAGMAVWALRSPGIIGERRGWLMLSAFGCVYVVGALRYAEYVAPPAIDVSLLQGGTEIQLVGRPTGAVPTRSGVRLFLDVDSVDSGKRRGTSVGRVQAYLPGYDPDDVNPCTRLRVSGRLADLPTPGNPGEFDYASYLRGRQVFFRFFARGRSSVEVYQRDETDLLCVAYRIKSTIIRRFELSVEDTVARSLILALLVGDRAGIDDEIETRFKRTGLLHLLAVSGLHVLIVGMIFYQLLRPILLRLGFSWQAAERTRTIATAIVLVLYALVTGMPASVVRAVVMAILFMTATLYQRSAHSLNTLAVAVVVLLTLRPPQLFEAGFQLSVAAVAAIISLQPRYASLFLGSDGSGYIPRSIRSSTSVSLAASAGTLPVLLYHFGSVSFAGLVLNTLAVPITSVTLASSVATAAAAGLNGELGLIFGQASQFFAQLLLLVVERGEPYFRWAYVEWPVDDMLIIAAIIVFLFALAQWPRPRTRWRLLTFMLVILGLSISIDAARGVWSPRLSVYFLDVGQGDAAVVRLPNGRTLLIDAGPRSSFSDAGFYTVLPLLRRNQIRRLDAIVITHPDSDHLGGLPSLLRHVAVGRIVHSGLSHDSDLFAESISLIDSLRIPYVAVRTGDTLEIDPTVRVQVLHPDGPRLEEDPNASSIVIRLQYGRTAFLLMGDAEAAAERAIVRRYADLLDVDVVKVGHHGSMTSSTPLFISRISLRNPIAVISVGQSNRYGLPDSSVVHRLASGGARLRRTDHLGAVWLVSDGERIIERRWQRE